MSPIAADERQAGAESPVRIARPRRGFGDRREVGRAKLSAEWKAGWPIYAAVIRVTERRTPPRPDSKGS